MQFVTLLKPEAVKVLTSASSKKRLMQDIGGRTVAYGDYAAEHSRVLASLVAAPAMLAWARACLPSGEEMLFDHCNALNRCGGEATSH